MKLGMHCVTWGPSSPPRKGAEPPIFGPYMLWPNGWMDQDATGKGLRLSPNDIVLDGDPPPPRKGAQQPTFQPAAVARIRIDFHKVAFILKSNTEDCINVH